MINFREGIPLKEIMSKSVTWPALFLVISVLELTGAFENSGVSKWIAEISQPLLAGFSGHALVFVIIFLATAITQLVNNNACAATFAPIAYTLAVANSSIDLPPSLPASFFPARSGWPHLPPAPWRP